MKEGTTRHYRVDDSDTENLLNQGHCIAPNSGLEKARLLLEGQLLWYCMHRAMGAAGVKAPTCRTKAGIIAAVDHF